MKTLKTMKTLTIALAIAAAGMVHAATPVSDAPALAALAALDYTAIAITGHDKGCVQFRARTKDGRVVTGEVCTAR